MAFFGSAPKKAAASMAAPEPVKSIAPLFGEAPATSNAGPFLGGPTLTSGGFFGGAAGIDTTVTFTSASMLRNSITAFETSTGETRVVLNFTGIFNEPLAGRSNSVLDVSQLPSGVDVLEIPREGFNGTVVGLDDAITLVMVDGAQVALDNDADVRQVIVEAGDAQAGALDLTAADIHALELTLSGGAHLATLATAGSTGTLTLTSSGSQANTLLDAAQIQMVNPMDGAPVTLKVAGQQALTLGQANAQLDMTQGGVLLLETTEGDAFSNTLTTFVTLGDASVQLPSATQFGGSVEGMAYVSTQGGLFDGRLTVALNETTDLGDFTLVLSNDIGSLSSPAVHNVELNHLDQADGRDIQIEGSGEGATEVTFRFAPSQGETLSPDVQGFSNELDTLRVWGEGDGRWQFDDLAEGIALAVVQPVPTVGFNLTLTQAQTMRVGDGQAGDLSAFEGPVTIELTDETSDLSMLILPEDTTLMLGQAGSVKLTAEQINTHRIDFVEGGVRPTLILSGDGAADMTPYHDIERFFGEFHIGPEAVLIIDDEQAGKLAPGSITGTGILSVTGATSLALAVAVASDSLSEVNVDAAGSISVPKPQLDKIDHLTSTDNITLTSATNAELATDILKLSAYGRIRLESEETIVINKPILGLIDQLSVGGASSIFLVRATADELAADLAKLEASEIQVILADADDMSGVDLSGVKTLVLAGETVISDSGLPGSINAKEHQLTLTNGVDFSGVTLLNPGALVLGTMHSRMSKDSYTLSVSQHEHFSAITGNGNDIVLSDQGSLTGVSDVASYTLAKGTSDSTFTLGALNQGVDATASSGDTLIFGAGAYTGAIQTDAQDTLIISGNANLSDINVENSGQGGAFNAETLTIAAGVTVAMSVEQHQGFTTINAADGAAIQLTTQALGGFELNSSVSEYLLGDFSNHVFLADGDGQTVTGGSGNDVIVTGNGNNTFFSSEGRDSFLNTGSGTHRYIYQDPDHSSSSAGRDIISWFKTGIDTFQFSLNGSIVDASQYATQNGSYWTYYNGEQLPGYTIVDTWTEATNKLYVYTQATNWGNSFSQHNNASVFSIDVGTRVPRAEDLQFIITGTDGDDSLTGGAGDDLIRGGLGANTLTGGQGQDTFVFTFGEHDVPDIITDFSAGTLGDILAIEKVLPMTANWEEDDIALSNATSGILDNAFTVLSQIKADSDGADDIAAALQDFHGEPSISAFYLLLDVEEIGISASSGAAVIFYDNLNDNPTLDAGELNVIATLPGVSAADMLAENIASIGA